MSHVTLIDLDEDAIEIARENINNLDLNEKIEIIRMDVNEIPSTFYKKFDVVLTNPPFGIRSKKSADVNFLKKAINVIMPLLFIDFFRLYLFLA